MSIVFKYSTFYDFYADTNNTLSVSPPQQIYYYAITNKYQGTWNLQSTTSSCKILVGNTDVFLTFKSGWIFFNILRLHNQKYLGDHLSIGFKKASKTLLGMHFTIQNETDGVADNVSKKCFIRDGVDISDVPNLKCQQPDSGYIHDYFTDDEIDIIEQILKKPFSRSFSSTSGGTDKAYHKSGQKVKVGIG